MANIKWKTLEYPDAYSCECGAIRPVTDPYFPHSLYRAIGGVPINACQECGKSMRTLPGTWRYYEVKKGIWPFRKLKEVHWEFHQEVAK